MIHIMRKFTADKVRVSIHKNRVAPVFNVRQRIENAHFGQSTLLIVNDVKQIQ